MKRKIAFWLVKCEFVLNSSRLKHPRYRVKNCSRPKIQRRLTLKLYIVIECHYHGKKSKIKIVSPDERVIKIYATFSYNFYIRTKRNIQI